MQRALSCLHVCLGICVLAGAARADDAARLDVPVGETAQVDVGIAMGLRCDDLAILHVELRTRMPEANVLEVTGVREGTTMCRVGTLPNRPTYLFEIHVVPPRPAHPAPPAPARPPQR